MLNGISLRVFGVCVFALIITNGALAQSASTGNAPSDPEILEILTERVGDDRQSIGIVVGIIEPTGRRMVSYGNDGRSPSRPVDGDTVFEIGSVTKVFTSLLLADMVAKGDIALNSAISNYLPPGVTAPTRNSREITLLDLATHTSALPRLPTNLSPSELENPYADYSVTQLYDFLTSYELPRDIGAQYEYSNYAVGLLGHILSLVAGEDYETLVRTRIAAPLEMNDTAIALTSGMEDRLATGHDQSRETVANWDLPTLAGAGALRSSANDLLSFLELHLGTTISSLAPAAASMLDERRPAGPGLEIALGWHIQEGDDTEYVWHNGGTGGYRSFIGFDPAAGVGVVALTNLSTAVGVDDIARHLLNRDVPILPSDSPLIRRPLDRTEISLSSDLLENYVGNYALAPNVTIAITLADDQLSLQLTGQPTIEIYPESETEFFIRVVDAQITFIAEGGKNATALVLHQNGQDLRAERR